MSDVRYALVPSENDVGRISFTAFVGSENVSIDMYMNFTDAPRNALPFFVLNNEEH